MKFLKKKTLWFTLYGILITALFLFLLFPSDIAQSKIEEAVHASDLTVKMESLRPSLPLGFKLKNIAIGPASPAYSYFQGETLDLQFKPVSFFQKNRYMGLSGRAYGGDFNGRFGVASFDTIYPPKEGKLKFKNIDLAKFVLIRKWLGKDIAGNASGIWSHSSGGTEDTNLSATLELFLTKGTFPLAEPFLGTNRIDFENGEIKATLQNGLIKLEKLHISGPQIECFLNGDITLAGEFKDSPLDLKGKIIIPGNKVKMNITISGTLANPAFRYI
jgi:type II secretion system protein N